MFDTQEHVNLIVLSVIAKSDTVLFLPILRTYQIPLHIHPINQLLLSSMLEIQAELIRQNLVIW